MDMVTMNAARAARLADYGLGAGRRADLVVVDATSVHEALRLCHVIFGGREGARASLSRELRRPPRA
jgi:cytosine/adenosine deaminase-related metal-dependent hydrolase